MAPSLDEEAHGVASLDTEARGVASPSPLAPLTLPTTTKASFEEALASPALLRQFRAANLLWTADRFVALAHARVQAAVSEPGAARAYSRLVAGAIQALETAVLRFDAALAPATRARAHLRLASIYFEETTSLDKAEDHVNRALVLATRARAVAVRTAAVVVATRVLHPSHPKAALSFLTSELDLLQREGEELPLARDYARVLHITRAVLMLGSPHQAVPRWRAIAADADADTVSRSVARLHLALLHTVQGRCGEAERALEQTMPDRPVQLTAMLLLTRLVLATRMLRFDECTALVLELNQFTKQQQAAGWDCWQNDGVVEVAVEGRVNQREQLHAVYHLQWLTASEYVALVYIHAGVMHLVQSHYLEGGGAVKARTRATRMLAACVALLDAVVAADGGSALLQQFHRQRHRLAHLKLLAVVYQCWTALAGGEWGQAQTLLQPLVERYGTTTTPHEAALMRQLAPAVHHLLGMASVAEGELDTARHHFEQVQVAPASNELATVQLGLGSPLSSDLVTAAGLHLVAIAELQLAAVETRSVGNPEFLRLTQRLGQLYSELDRAVEAGMTPESLAVYTAQLRVYKQRGERGGEVPAGVRVVWLLVEYLELHQLEVLDKAAAVVAEAFRPPVQLRWLVQIARWKEAQLRRNAEVELADLEKTRAEQWERELAAA